LFPRIKLLLELSKHKAGDAYFRKQSGKQSQGAYISDGTAASIPTEKNIPADSTTARSIKLSFKTY
jgi:hypothetical protein